MKKSNRVLLTVFAILLAVIFITALLNRLVVKRVDYFPSVVERVVAAVGNDDDRYQAIHGDGHLISKNYTLGDFTALELSLNSQIEITVKENNEAPSSVIITADSNILQHLEVEKSDAATLDLSDDGFRLKPSKPIKILITSKHGLQKIGLDGATRVKVSGLNSKNFSVTSSGASSALLFGQVQNLSLDVSGAGRVDARDLIADNADVTVSGASNIQVYAKELLKIDVSGAARISYFGNPKKVTPSISGVARVEAAD